MLTRVFPYSRLYLALPCPMLPASTVRQFPVPMVSLNPATMTDYPVSADASLGSWPTLLVADPDAATAQAIVCFFEKRGFHVAAGSTLAEIRDFLYRRKSWTLVIADCHLPDGNGIEVRDCMDEHGCQAPLLLMSSNPHCAISGDGIDYLAKPFALEKLDQYVRTVRR